MDRRAAFLYNRNGTLEVVYEDLLSPVASGVIIVICLLLGVCYNLLVIGAVVTSNKLRHSPFHLVLLMLAIVCLLDCVVNESLAIGFLYDLGPSACTTSATFFHLFLLFHSATLSLLFLERTLAFQEHSVSVRMTLGAVLTIWIFGLVFSSILLVSSDIHFFPNRNACSGVKTNLMSPSVYFLAFLTCWTITTTTCFLCVKSVRSHNDSQHVTILSVLPTLTDADIPPSRRPPAKQNKLASTILFMYTTLILPHTVSVVVNLFLTPTFEADPWLDPRVGGQVKTVITNSLEPLFTYTRYIYDAVVPIAVLVTNHETRKQGRQVFCCRWNEVSNLNSSEINSSPAELSGELQISTTPYDLTTPVLLATPDGLHLRVPQIIVAQSNSGMFNASNTSFKLVTTFCDLRTNPEERASSTGTISFRDQQIQDTGENDHPDITRNVRFSSKVDEIMHESGVWSSSGQGSNLSATHTVNIPLIVKDEQFLATERRDCLNNV